MPGKYCILLRPQFEHGGRKTLGTSFLTDNQPNMGALREHFEPIIAQQEDDYNDKFCLNTQVQVRNITKDEKLLQTAPILKAIKSQNKTITNAILESNKAIVEAIKSTRTDPSPRGGVNWTPSPCDTNGSVWGAGLGPGNFPNFLRHGSVLEAGLGCQGSSPRLVPFNPTPVRSKVGDLVPGGTGP